MLQLQRVLMISTLLLIWLCHIPFVSSLLMPQARFSHHTSRHLTMAASDNPIDRNSNLNNIKQSSIWSDQVQYIDLTSMDISSSPTSRPLPLFLLGGAFYPKGNTFLHVFEMKYRTMMFDVAKNDNMFGYIHTDQVNGRIAQIGTLCKITATELLEDGRQYIELEGVGRFKVRKILKTLPYVMAEVDVDLMDDMPSDVQAAANLEMSVYDALKYYMRLMKSYSPNSEMVVSQAAKKSRPTRTNGHDHARRTDFSFALANMIQMTQDYESQLLLQTTDIMKRLDAERLILTQAADSIAEKLIQMNFLSAEKRDTIKTQTYTKDYDDDILPPDVLEKETVVEKDEWDISNVM